GRSPQHRSLAAGRESARDDGGVASISLRQRIRRRPYDTWARERRGQVGGVRSRAPHMIRYATLLAFGMPPLLLAQSESRSLPPDPSKPVPAKSEIIAAWQKRQSGFNSFRFAWTEEQIHPRGWLANPRYPERERLAKPDLLIDRRYNVEKNLAVAGNRMRYSFVLDRSEEPDGVDVVARQGDNRGLGVRRHYSYV